MLRNAGHTIIIDTIAGQQEVAVSGGRCIYMASGVRGPKGDPGTPGTPGTDGVGIASVELIETSGKQKTYRMTFTDGDYFEYIVTDGDDGQDGEPGKDGAPGEDGQAATIAVGTVTTLPAGSSATVTNSGTESAAVFDFGIPEGEQGDPGASEWGSITGTLSDQTDLAEALDSKADIITRSVSGSLVHIEDGAPRNVSALSVGIEPVQNLHGYDNPWPAGGGKNLLDPSVLTTQAAWLSVPLSLPAGTYTMSTNYVDGSGLGMYFLKNSSDTQGSTTLVHSTHPVTRIVEEGDDPYIKFRRISGDKEFSSYNWQIELGSSATSWSPYANICPISGWSQANVTRTGKNIAIPAVAEYSIYSLDISCASNGEVTIDGTAGANITSSTYYFCEMSVFAGTYSIMCDYFVTGTYMRVVDGSGSILASCLSADTPYTFTVAQKTTIRICMRIASGTAFSNQKIRYCLAYGSHTTLDYEPFLDQQVTIALGDTYYGGTLDVLTGTLTVTDKCVTYNGSESWQPYASQNGFNYNPTDMSVGTSQNGISSWLPTVAMASAFGIRFGIGNGVIYVNHITDTISGVTDVESWKAYLAQHPLTIVYPLATPTVITGLTTAQMQTLLGVNNIWADTGATSMTYRADTKMYIDEQIAESAGITRKMIADSAINGNAPKSLASGDLIIVGDELRKCTSNIGNGSAITSSNSTIATLADVIKALQ